MSYRHEIWTIAQRWITINKNVEKEGKKRKRGEKYEVNEKDENKK